jgi:hypothetical protein
MVADAKTLGRLGEVPAWPGSVSASLMTWTAAAGEPSAYFPLSACERPTAEKDP